MKARWTAQSLVGLALLVWLFTGAYGCNLNDPDVVRDVDAADTDSDTTTGDATTDASSDSTQSDSSEDTDADAQIDGQDDDAADADACEELSVADFCTQNSAECGSLTVAGRCEDTRTEICGTCTGNETCIDNVCTCVSPWTGDGIDAAFMDRTQVYVTNQGYIWGYAPDTETWSQREPLSSATTPIDFTLSAPVAGTSLWDDDGPTAAVSTDKAILFFNGSLYWLYDKSMREWIASGDLNDPGQEDFDLRRDLQRNIFGDGTVEAALSEDRKTFYAINGDVFHEFEIQDLSPVEIQQKTIDPVLLEELFPNQWFEGTRARPWDRGMTWGAYSSNTFDGADFVVLGSENQSWVGPNDGPLVSDEVGPNSDIYGGAACTR
ncbi:MAG: hypothetical protein ACQEVA_18865 [Myxococcota bacterium]